MTDRPRDINDLGREGLRLVNMGAEHEEDVGAPHLGETELPYETTPDGRPYIVVPPGSQGCWFVATRAGGYIPIRPGLLRQTLERHWPSLETYTREPEKPPRPMSASSLWSRYGAHGSAVYYTYLGKSRFVVQPQTEGDGHIYVQTLHRPRVAPVRHEDVLAFFEVLFGERLQTMLDWLATIDQLDKPTGMPVLIGEHSIGKSMFAEGVSKYFGQAIAKWGDVFKDRFNAALLHSPLVILDEKNEGESRSGSFRETSANSTHMIEGKGTPSGTLLGCVRLIVVANSSDPMQLGRELLERADEEAIGRRVILVDCCTEAAEWLKSRGGRSYTHDWITRGENMEPGKIAETVAWLVENHDVVPGSRFLVEGDSREWAARIGARRGTPALIIEAARRFLELPLDERNRFDKLPAYVDHPRHPGKVLVFHEPLKKAWRKLMGDLPPSEDEMTHGLSKLSGMERGKQTRGPWHGRPRAHFISRDVHFADLFADDEDGGPDD